MNLSEKYVFSNSYTVYGVGEKAYFTFHGFGQNPSVYKRLATILPNSIIYSFHLFERKGNSDSTIYPTKSSWVSDFEALIDSLQIDKVNLVAHSMGARHVGAILEVIPSKVGKVYLIAPNGFERFNLFDFCTRTKVGKFIFNNFLKYYDRITALLDLAKSFPPTKELLLFAQSQINHKNKRSILQATWNAYGKFNLNQKLIKQNIIDFNVSMELVLARRDQIINNKNLLKLFGQIKSVEIQYMETAHYQILAEWMNQISIKKR